MNTYKGSMYHGTDKKILRMDRKEREERLALCAVISEYAYSFLLSKTVKIFPYTEEELLNKKKLEDIWNQFRFFGMIMYEGFKNKSRFYQYDCLYVSNNFDRAANYARNSFVMGERGYVTYWLYKGASRYDDYYESAPEEIKSAIRNFKEILEEMPEPVVVVMNNLDKQYIKKENGTDIDWDVSEEFFMSEGSAISFRLTNPQDYDLLTMKCIDV